MDTLLPSNESIRRKRKKVKKKSKNTFDQNISAQIIKNVDTSKNNSKLSNNEQQKVKSTTDAEVMSVNYKRKNNSKEQRLSKNKQIKDIDPKKGNIDFKRKCSDEDLPKTKKNKKQKLLQKKSNFKHKKPKAVDNRAIHTGIIKQNLNDESEDSNEELKSNVSNESDNSDDIFMTNVNSGSEDSEEDFEIRKEIENLPVYKKLQRLFTNEATLCVDSSENEDDSVEFIEKPAVVSDENTTNKSSFECNKVSTRDNYKAPTKESSHVNLDIPKIEKMSPIPDYVKMYQEEGILCRNQQSKSKKKNTTFQSKAREKLQAAKFRYLNEKLYTESGKDSFNYFQNNKDEFIDYHTGYNQQISKWPINPVDKIISCLQNLKKKLIIADLGCGDAKIARTLTHFTVHSYDLVSLNEHVTPCNISNVPLTNESVDVVVFCLSLMGTNLKDYIKEAYRITKPNGSVKIAEVESRIPDLDNFIKSIESFGFILENKDVANKIFVFLEFKKNEKKTKKTKEIVLKPCLYKKR